MTAMAHDHDLSRLQAVSNWLRHADAAKAVNAARDYRSDAARLDDTATVAGPDGKPVPGIAPAAKQQGRYIAKVLRGRLRGDIAPHPFRYRHAGSLATIGKRLAVIDFGCFKLRGALAWWIWGFAHIYFLIGVHNRLSVVLNWLWIYTRDQRSARLINPGTREY